MNWKTIKTLQVGRIRIPKEDEGHDASITVSAWGLLNGMPKEIEIQRKHMESYRVLIQKGTPTRKPKRYNFTLKCCRCGNKHKFTTCPGKIEKIGATCSGKEAIKFLMMPPGLDEMYFRCLPHKGGCGWEEFVIVKEV